MPKTIIGIMGPGEKAKDDDLKNAYEIGKLSAQAGYIVLTGGRPSGVMDAGLRGAKEAGGQTLGILPFKTKDDASAFADVIVVTGLNSARNFVNALTSDVIVACGVEAGTLSEIALALKENKHVVLMTQNRKAQEFLVELKPNLVHLAQNADEAMGAIRKILSE
jgi:uncharacterized protein (TIGR00725 family)